MVSKTYAMGFVKVFLISVVTFVFLEGLVFRTGFYPRYIEPSSSTGQMEGTLRDERNRRPFGPDEVLVTGDSRIGEGFSPKTANAGGVDHPYYFANVAVAGTTPRSVYFLLRDLDPSRKRYRAIIFPVDSYEDIDAFEDMADRLLDLHFCVARLRYQDIIPFAFSFNTGRHRMEAFRGSLFKGLVFQSDLLALMEHRHKRLRDVAAWREHGWEWQDNYTGHTEDLAGISVNWETKTIQFPERLPESHRDSLLKALFGPIPPQNGATARYRRQWFGRIFDLYRDSNTRIIFLALPRGPVVPPVARIQAKSQTIRDFARERRAILLPEPLFSSLEDGKFYFDSLHLNARGRVQFSTILAQSIRSILGPSRN
jgi:hypothetical protein